MCNTSDKKYLLGLVGHKQAGKDSVGRILQQHFPLGTYRLAFADALKQELATLTGGNLEAIEKNKEILRPVLQWYGTEFRRNNFGNDYWIKRVEQDIAAIKSPALIYITDVRFRNEAEYIRSKGGLLIKVERPCLSENSHASETQVDEIACHRVIKNDQTLQLLFWSVLDMIPYIKQHFKIQD